MTGYRAFSAVRMILALLVFVGGGILSCAMFIWHEISLEHDFHARYGANWRAEYEQTFGSLSDAHTKVGVAAFGLVVIPTLVLCFGKYLRDQQNPSRNNKMAARKPRVSSAELRARCRRNAVIGIYFGVAGVAAGVLLVIFRWGLFQEHVHEIILGMFIFLAGYLGIIAGCGWWLKAKQWSEAVVIIGLLPLGIAMIPFVRLVLLVSPVILPFGMIMMSLILIAVVFALPDKSGSKNQRLPWSWKDLNNHAETSSAAFGSAQPRESHNDPPNPN